MTGEAIQQRSAGESDPHPREKGRAHRHRPALPRKDLMVQGSAMLGDRIADGFARVVGSWRFIIIQSVILAAWIVLNVLAIIRRWDPYPFILLNLMLSFQAAYTGPILLMAANRSARKDRARDEHEADETDIIYQIQLEQLEILRRLDLLLSASSATGTPVAGAAGGTAAAE